MIVLGIEHQKNVKYRQLFKNGNKNGAYWYAKEIEENILPHLKHLDVVVVTAGATLFGRKEIFKGSVIVCHDNRQPTESYRRLLGRNMIWVCSKHSTVDKLRDAGETAIYIPLSIDTEYVKQFKTEKTKDIAFVGNAWSFKKKYLESLPPHIDQLSGMEREDLLREMAKYKRIIAEGRCLMEAQVLGAETEVPQYEDGIESVYVEALDNRDTIEYWRLALETCAEIQKNGE